MLLPPQYAWFEPVLIASIVVFIIDLIGNSITFSNRYVSALVSALLFALVFGGLTYFGVGNVSMSLKAPTVLRHPQKSRGTRGNRVRKVAHDTWNHPARHILMLLGVIPTWPHSRAWGYGPSGLSSTVLIIVLILVLLGKL